MGILDKVKDFFYDEEEIEEEVPIRRKEKPKKEEKTVEKKFNIYDIEKETENEKNKEMIHTKPKIKKVVEPEVSERELFRSERTFNFPVDLDETREFKQATVEIPQIKEERVVERPVTRRPVQQTPRYNSYQSYPTPSGYTGYKKDAKRFKPSPVISPIYGVLNENYKKDDIIDTGKTRTMMEGKPTEFDKVREKAFKEKEKEEDFEKTFNDTPKDIFYNMDEEEKKIEDTKEVELEVKEEIQNEYEEEPYKKDDEVIITYGEVEDDTPETKEAEEIDIKEKEVEEDDDIEIPTISKRTKKVVEEESEEKEDNDVFKIIDNMYNEEDDEGEEE